MKKKEMLELIDTLKRKRDTCALHDMTFSPLPEEFKPKVEQYQKERFFRWWNTWILPGLLLLEKELYGKDCPEWLSQALNEGDGTYKP